ncbi:hypothetical protein PFISCL1PPCAC_18406, partial [Pristionchus fissidentatus]
SVPYEEPRLCRLRVILVARILFIFALVLSVIEMFFCTTDAATIALSLEIISFVGTLILLAVFQTAISARSVNWMVPVLMLDAYNAILPVAQLVIAILTATQANTFMCRQV